MENRGRKRKVSGTILAGTFTVPAAMSAVQQNAVSANLLTDLPSSVSNFFTKKAGESFLKYAVNKILPTVIVVLGVVTLLLFVKNSTNKGKIGNKKPKHGEKPENVNDSKIKEMLVNNHQESLTDVQKEIIEKIENFDLDFDLIDMGKIKINEERKIDPKINEFIYNEGYGPKKEERYTVIKLKKEDVKIFSEIEITDKKFIDLPEDSEVDLYIKSVDKDGKFTFTINGEGEDYKSKALGKRTAFMNMVLMARCKQNLNIEGNLKNKFKFLVNRDRPLSKKEKLVIFLNYQVLLEKIPEIKFENLGNSETALKDLKTVKEGIEELPKKEKYIFENLIKKKPAKS